jgi:hypothetical protein
MSTSTARKRKEDEGPTLFDYMAPADLTETYEQLARIAWELSGRPDVIGVSVGEVVLEAETNRGIKVGGVPMENKTREQRQTSNLPRIMKMAGLVATLMVRPSPVPRHHKHRHTVWVRPEIRDVQR